MASQLNLQQKIIALEPKIIDPSKCLPRTSLYHQIQANAQSTIDNQNRKFNLGNGQLFTDPILAADQLLLREYADSALFDTNRHNPIFIPNVFQSHQYTKKDSTVHLLDYDVDINTLKKSLDNLKKDSPAYWFTGELQAFYDLQLNNSGDEINAREFSNWILNVKIMYLLMEEIGNQPTQGCFRMLCCFRQPSTNDLTLPSTTEDSKTFIQACIQKLASKSPGSKLEQTLKKTLKDAKKEVENLVKQNQPSHSTIKWLFGLVLSELGEKGEHSFFRKLYSLKDDPVLEDTVILSSINFLTNVQKKMHQEIDVLLFSWTKKLIIGVEIKRTLTGKAFDQLNKYHKLIEGKLGDQLGHGWTYHPVICVGTDDLSFNNQHYIDQETDLKCWLSTLLAKYPTVSSGIPFIPAVNQVKDLLRIIVFAIHASKTASITRSNWVEYISQAIDTVCTTDNILFYSQRQLPIMKTDTSEFDKIILLAPYGCGKSFILQEKAKQLSGMAQYKGRVMYAIETSDLETLLKWRLKDELGKEHGVDVYGYRDYSVLINEEEIEKLMERIKTKKINALFIDECWITREKTKEMVMKVKQHVDVIWIASNGYGHRDILLGDEDLSVYDDFIKFELDVNLRNCESIAKEALSYEERYSSGYKEGLVLPPPNHPDGEKPYHFVSFEDAMKEMRRITNNGVLVISHNLPYEADDFQTLNKLKLKWKRYGEYKNDFNTGESPYQYLKDGNILLVEDYELIIGFEWENIIILVKEDNAFGLDNHPCNLFMRCTTNLMLVDIVEDISSDETSRRHTSSDVSDESSSDVSSDD
ncbi:uncharacterized protein [Clytia hemisphaerica]|uniref:Uncharacterized protein n=1 Tax=Clytia hemisphaerica TaxID=252671 RepID=A0A7M5WS41_9CNID